MKHMLDTAPICDWAPSVTICLLCLVHSSHLVRPHFCDAFYGSSTKKEEETIKVVLILADLNLKIENEKRVTFHCILQISTLNYNTLSIWHGIFTQASLHLKISALRH